MKKKTRFRIVHSEGVSLTTNAKILVDQETGVHYLIAISSGVGGITPLLGVDGKPVISLDDMEEDDENLYEK